MRHKLVAGNWMMHGDLLSNTTLLEALRPGLAALRDAEYCCCVPYPYLSQVAGLLSGTRIWLGAQDVSEFKGGAYTGEVSAEMLCDT